jgi:hypothetical protein
VPPKLRLVLASLLIAALVAAVLDGRPSPGAGPERSVAAGPKELPRGGTSIFPRNRVVSFYGAPQSPELGILGIGKPGRAARKLRRVARRYRRPGRRVLPAFELISVIALASPGKDGKYRARQSRRTIRRYLRVARRHRYLLLLDIQPGRSTFSKEVRALRPFLRQRDVGVALDPEWNMGPGGVPGERIGSVHAREVNRVTRYLQRLINRRNLPEKLVVIHQFTPKMVREKSKLKDRPGIDLVLNSDGFGTAAQKRAKYRQLAPRFRSPFHRGFKLFYKEDTGLMKPGQVLKLRPRPVDLVIYE